MSDNNDRNLMVRLYCIFFLSGISGLVYEVIWMRMLLRIFGVTIYAVSTVLTVFMAGLAIGAIVIAYRASGKANLLRWYAIIEILIGLTAALSSFAIYLMPEGISTTLQSLGANQITAARFLISTIVLFPTTFLLGTTLPLVSGYLSKNQATVGSRVGMLYSLNTLGAVLGVLGTGFIGLYYLGEIGTLSLAVAINLAVGMVALLLSKKTFTDNLDDSHQPNGPQASEPQHNDPQHHGSQLNDPQLNDHQLNDHQLNDHQLNGNLQVESPPAPHAMEASSALEGKILWLIAISGFSALAFQVVWARILTLLLGSSVYAFSLMLSIYLIGISIGSAVASRYADKLKQTLLAFATLEFAIVVFAVISLHSYGLIGLMNDSNSYTYSQLWSSGDFLRILLSAIIIIFPVTFFLGAIFPIVSKLCVGSGPTTEMAIGKVYGFNTIGAIFGSFVTGFILIPLIGTHLSFLFACFISALIAMALICLSNKWEQRNKSVQLNLGIALVFSILVYSIPNSPFANILERRIGPQDPIIAHVEDKTATVTMTENLVSKHRTLFINGLYVSNTSESMGSFLVSYPLQFHANPKKILIIGLGIGEALKTGLIAGLDTTVVELVPTVAKLFRQFDPDAERFLASSRSHLVFNDGRNFLFTTKDQFDYMIIDGSPPVFASGMVNLYSYDFMQLAKQHLTEEGIFSIWLPSICFEHDVWMLARNFADAFSHVGLFAVRDMGGIMLLGSNSSANPFTTEVQTLANRLASRGIANAQAHANFLLDNMLFDDHQIRTKSAAYPRMTDNRPYTEFPLTSFLKGIPYHLNNHFIFDSTIESQ